MEATRLILPSNWLNDVAKITWSDKGETANITFSDVKSFKSVLMMFHIVDFSGLNKLHSITKGDLFLCDSGDEILRGEERCDLRNDCYDFSDEKNCSNRKLRL